MHFLQIRERKFCFFIVWVLYCSGLCGVDQMNLEFVSVVLLSNIKKMLKALQLYYTKLLEPPLSAKFDNVS